MNSTAVWKFIAGILASMLLSGFATYHATTGDFATKTEMTQSLASDHELIKETRDDVKQMRDQIDSLVEKVGELRGPRR